MTKSFKQELGLDREFEVEVYWSEINVNRNSSHI